jgi:pimeloyl-ACP methyl ester carboxylesterase
MARRVTWAHRHRFAEVNGVKAPALVVTGEPDLDHVVPVDVSRRYLDDLAGAEHVILPRTGHNGLVTRPDDFANVLGRFVDGLRLSA